jgi:hypothetical protein
LSFRESQDELPVIHDDGLFAHVYANHNACYIELLAHCIILPRSAYSRTVIDLDRLAKYLPRDRAHLTPSEYRVYLEHLHFTAVSMEPDHWHSVFHDLFPNDSYVKSFIVKCYPHPYVENARAVLPFFKRLGRPITNIDTLPEAWAQSGVLRPLLFEYGVMQPSKRTQFEEDCATLIDTHHGGSMSMAYRLASFLEQQKLIDWGTGQAPARDKEEEAPARAQYEKT